MNITIEDIKPKADLVHEYTTAKSESTPLIIDNGSYKCRVGWSSNSAPLLEIRNLIAKPRKDRKKEIADVPMNSSVQIGSDISNIEAVRMQLKTQFDRNIVTHYYNQEQILDYIFTHLSINHDRSVPHPIVMTEAFANPNSCRQQMNELLFECYGVPSICYGVDSLLSFKHNDSIPNALILSFGYHTTHVIPILNGRVQTNKVRRINIGGYHIITYLYRLMQMKYPVHHTAITISRIETLLHQHGSVAVDYQKELHNWAQSNFYSVNVKKIQLPYTAPAQNVVLTAEQKYERRKELSRRLIESNNRRAKEKQKEDECQLKTLCNIRKLYDQGEESRFSKALRTQELTNLTSLDKQINILRNRIEKAKQKLNNSSETACSSTAKMKLPAFMKPPMDVPLEDWISDVRNKRSETLKRKNERKTKRQDIVKRHTAAAQERMRIISLLARNEKGTDEFGIDDKDWDVYKTIKRGNDSESDNDNEKLVEYENILRHYDSKFEETPMITISAEHYQLHVGVELIRAPELLFQPSLIGNPEAGLTELIDFVLKMFSTEEQQLLVNHIFMTGGCSQFKGLKERLHRELLEMRPFQTTFQIFEANLPEIDAWLGAADIANSDDFNSLLSTKSDYEEKGSEYFKTHDFNNLYFQTPKQ